MAVLDFVSVMCESLLIGAYAVLVGFIIYLVKIGHRTMPRVHKVLFSASIFMFAISIAHLGLVMEQVTQPRVPKVNFQVQVVLSVVQYITGDLILIWRVWVIWGRKHWIVIVPLATLLVSAGFTLNLVRYTEERHFFTVAPVAMIVVNTTLCTLLIAGRIWYMDYRLRKANVSTGHSRGYKRVIALVIETGALYALAQLISLILDRTGSPGLSVMLNLEIPLIGILPTLIIVLVHFQRLPGTKMTQSYVQSVQRPKPPRPPIPIHLAPEAARSMSDGDHPDLESNCHCERKAAYGSRVITHQAEETTSESETAGHSATLGSVEGLKDVTNTDAV